MIDLTSVTVARSGKALLQDINLSIPDQGIVALIGPNGAGKSTLLHSIAGLLKPESGAVTIDGQDLYALSDAQRARVLSFLTQSQIAVPRLTVKELISFGRWPHHRGRPGPEDHSAIDDALTRFDLNSLAERQVESLSGGQKQRAFVAMAYAQSTPWIFLDEPLAALDPKFTRDIMDRLREMTDRSIVIVLHDLTIAANYADWFVGLKDGSVAFTGNWDSVGTAETLSALFDVSLDVAEVNGRRTVGWAD